MEEKQSFLQDSVEHISPDEDPEGDGTEMFVTLLSTISTINILIWWIDLTSYKNKFYSHGIFTIDDFLHTSKEQIMSCEYFLKLWRIDDIICEVDYDDMMEVFTAAKDYVMEFWV